MKKKEWKREYKDLYEKYLLLRQSSLNCCKECAWNTVLPNGVCLNCEYWDREEKKDQLAIEAVDDESHKGVLTLTVEFNAQQSLALQRRQYRNGEPLAHTLLRLAGLVPEPTPDD